MLELLYCEYISQLVRFEVLTAVIMKRTVFWNVTPYSLEKVYQRSGGTYCVHLQGWVIGQGSKQRGHRAYRLAFSVLKMESVHSSETLVNFFNTTPHYIPEDSATIHFLTCLRIYLLFWGSSVGNILLYEMWISLRCILFNIS